MEWTQQEVGLITQVLCRLELPDQAVYPALARARDAVHSGHKISIQRATKALTDVFLESVRQGLVVRIGDSPWAALSARPELQPLARELRRRAAGLETPISLHGSEIPAQVHRSIMEFETTFEGDPWHYRRCKRRILQSLQSLLFDDPPPHSKLR